MRIVNFVTAYVVIFFTDSLEFEELTFFLEIIPRSDRCDDEYGDKNSDTFNPSYIK
jgi:hypothetical protein